VESAVASPTSDIVVVVVRLFGCVGGEEQTARDLEVVGVLVEVPRACPGGFIC
jgi:hypothetical protein